MSVAENNDQSTTDINDFDVTDLYFNTSADNTCEPNIIKERSWSDVDSLVIIRARIKYGGRGSAVKGFFYEYFRHTSIHGLRYIFSVHRPVYEKLFWLIFTLISFYFAISLSWSTFMQWQDAPVIVTFDETLVPIYKIPFPTVTICAEVKMEQNICNFTKISESLSQEIGRYGKLRNYDNFTQEDFVNFGALLQVCDDDVTQRFRDHVLKETQPHVAQTLIEISVPMNDTAPYCKWDSQFFLCTDIFNLVATSEGICYQFNGLKPQDIYRNLSEVSYYSNEILDFQKNATGSWSLEDGFVGQGYESYPRRTVFSAVRNAFFAFLQGFAHNVEYACRSVNQGYRIFFSSPESVPLTSNNYILVPPEEEVILSVIPQYITADISLREFSPEKRQCYFNDERYLRYFKHYSEANCQTECLANFTMQKCGCAKFWMPKPPDVPICLVADILCANEAKIELDRLLQSQSMQNAIDSNSSMNCNCMPSCTSLEFNVEISRARYDINKLWQAWKEEAPEDTLGSRLCVFFKESQFTAIKRTVLFNLTSFLANCGGILGLFIGFSSLSLAEFFYFLCLRSFSNYQKRRRTNRRILKLIAEAEATAAAEAEAEESKNE